ncbi:hypothetical protein [Chromobacterium sp. Panama]|uniref:hypothetical protein n=1 Tax=Chromobacterium sp. Panama TaxID=2161826 RepID=UPI0011B249C2|nr:hypothetical protein [Chromobacterium sp. Panama]
MKKPIHTWKTYQVVFVGALSFIVSGFYLFVLGDVIPDLIKTSNKVPLEDWWPKGVLLWLFCGVLALLIWPFATVAQRCHEVLKERFVG